MRLRLRLAWKRTDFIDKNSAQAGPHALLKPAIQRVKTARRLLPDDTNGNNECLDKSSKKAASPLK
jgi:hypothetical protein